MSTSDLFEDKFLGGGGGTPVGHCCCGRTVYCDSEYYEDGERDLLDKRAAEDPDKVVYQEYDAVSIVAVDGREYVHECPCDGLGKMERFIWSRRDRIAAYLAARCEEEARGRNKVIGELQRATGGKP